jgi:hypothetical protein
MKETSISEGILLINKRFPHAHEKIVSPREGNSRDRTEDPKEMLS